VSELSEVVDVLQVPALLCRQTDLVKSAAFHGRVVNVKKGQFMAPWDMANVVSKCRAVSNGKEVWLTERGTSFGYNRVVVDFTGLPVMKGFADRVIADCSHTVQLPCSGGDCSGGKRELVPLMARLGMAAGADGLFIEVHSDPDFALCDGPSSLAIDDLEGVLKMALGVERAVA
jgi:2-dehydro-3-deoxyphosphooctonate aldolase (KDO 8-P synthase)